MVFNWVFPRTQLAELFNYFVFVLAFKWAGGGEGVVKNGFCRRGECRKVKEEKIRGMPSVMLWKREL